MESSLIGKIATFRHNSEMVTGVVLATYIHSSLKPTINTYGGSIKDPPLGAFLEEIAIIEKKAHGMYNVEHIPISKIVRIESK